MFFKNQTKHYTELCEKLEYSFKNKKLLKQALTRTTAILEGVQDDIGDSQRLEFLGDKVIGLAISSILFTKYPNYKEGTLTQLCSQLTSNNALAKLAKRLNLGNYLVLGKSDESNNVRNNKKALADVVESLFGAIFIDSDENFKVIKDLILKHWQVLGLEPLDNDFKEEKNVYLAEDEIDKLLIKNITSGTATDVEHCLKKGAKPNVAHEVKYLSGGYFLSALQLVITANQDKYEKMELLLKYGAEPNWQEGYQLIDVTPFPKMVNLSELFKERKLKKYFAKHTALHIVVESFMDRTLMANEACKMIKLLVEYKANPNAVDAKGNTPLQLPDYLNIQNDGQYVDGDDLNKVKNLLQSLSITKEPTSKKKIKQDFINDVIDEVGEYIFPTNMDFN